MRYLVTGGAGFIGSNLVRALLSNNLPVRVLDNLSTGRVSNLEDLGADIEFIEGDIRDSETVAAAVQDVKVVFHIAALPSVQRSVEDPATSSDVNINGTLGLLMAARDAGVETFVFSSSSSVYGDTPALPKHEDMLPMPLSPYAVQKLTGEHYCRIFHQLYALRTFCLRYFNVFGPRQDPNSDYAAVIPRFISRIMTGEAPIIYGDGEQTRDFTYVESVVRANMLCAGAPDEAAGGVYNIAEGTRTSVKDLAAALIGILGKNIKPVHEAARAGDVRDSQGDSNRARTALAWEPGVSLEDGLKKTVEYFSGQ